MLAADPFILPLDERFHDLMPATPMHIRSNAMFIRVVYRSFFSTLPASIIVNLWMLSFPLQEFPIDFVRGLARSEISDSAFDTATFY